MIVYKSEVCDCGAPRCSCSGLFWLDDVRDPTVAGHIGGYLTETVMSTVLDLLS